VARILLAAEALIYGGALAAVGISSAVKYREGKMGLGVPLAIGLMHFSWGSGFLWSALKAGTAAVVSLLSPGGDSQQ
jgi:hypothetical protein